jgi:hypothetical protein
VFGDGGEAMASDESLLDQIRKRPAMYLGEYSLSALSHFISGYCFALDIHAIRRSSDPNALPRDFHDWVAYRLHFKESTSGWCSMILTCAGSEKDAFDRFFSLLDEYHARRPHLVAKLVGIRQSYVRTCGEITEELQFPTSISLVTYTDDPGFFVLSDTDDEFPVRGFFPCIDWFETFTDVKRARLTIIDHEWNYGMRSSDS